MIKSPQPRRPQPSEEGYVLLAVIFILAILILSLTVALPKIRESIQRDREVETMHRGKQYVRAIQLYYRKFGAYPPNIDALVKTGEIRFLRKRYIDPITGKDDWKPIHFGQNKTPTAMGFFGQPLAGSTLAGTGPGGTGGIAGATTPGTGLNSSSSSDSGFGSGGFGSSSGLGGSSGAIGTSPTSGGFGSTSPTGTTGASTSGASSTGSGTGATGQTFGGAGIIGFSPASPKQSILIYKKKDHYDEWEFTYDPITDRKMVGNAGAIGQPASGISNGIGGAGTGNQNNNGMGINPGGSTPVTPTSPSQPQQ
jgi:type II secretory pathway pseudopilin PulG